MEELVKDLQKQLNDNGHRDKDGRKLTVDGDLGPLTRGALSAALKPCPEPKPLTQSQELREVLKVLESGAIGGRRNVGDDLRRLRLDARAIGRKLGLPIKLEGEDAEEGHGIQS